MTEAHYYNERIAHFPDGEGRLAAWLPAFPRPLASMTGWGCRESQGLRRSVCRNKENSSLGEGEVTSGEEAQGGDGARENEEAPWKKVRGRGKQLSPTTSLI